MDAGPGRDDLWPVQNKTGIEARFTAPGTGTMTREGLAVAFTGIDNVDGTRFDDVIIDSSADEWFVAGGAHDQGDLVEGGGGDDYLEGTGVVRGGAGNDEIDANGTADGGPGDDKVRSDLGRFDDTVIGGSGDDRINLLSAEANATVRAGRGNDSIVFWRPVEPNPSKHQRLDGVPGRDYLDFHDRYAVSPRLRIDLGQGRARAMNDTWRGRLIGIEDVRGSASDDRILGDGSGNRLDGGDGRDYVNGRGGRDTCRAEKTVNCER